MMRRLVSGLLAATMAVGAMAAMAAPGSAAPFPAKIEGAPSMEVTPIQYRRGFYRNGNFYYYNGQRGYRYARPGWRPYNGWYFPPSAFVIGGAIVQPQVVVRPAGNAHVRWCFDRYRSYRAYDNTYQPSYGPRRQCLSPYR